MLKEPSSKSKNVAMIRRHFFVGWWGLAGYVLLGILLEMLHGFKLDYYLDVRNETRRLLWTLAHAHGTLLSLVNISFACSLTLLAPANTSAMTPVFASWSLILGWLLLPVGFFLGGFGIRGGDPGWGILCVPVGGFLLLCGTVLSARTFSQIFKKDAIEPN